MADGDEGDTDVGPPEHRDGRRGKEAPGSAQEVRQGGNKLSGEKGLLMECRESS